MVSDLDENLREMGVGDMSIGKKVKGLTEIFYGRVKQYKEALEQENLEQALSAVFHTRQHDFLTYVYHVLNTLKDAPTDNFLQLLKSIPLKS